MKIPELIKQPLVHFVLIGLALFVGTEWLWPNDAAGRAQDTRIVVSRSQVAALVSRYEAASGVAATDEVRAALIARFAEEEMLYREAYRWGLASDNPAVELRLRQKMAFVSDGDLADEELARQAEALGLDTDDAVIRNMFVHNMRLLLARKGEREPSRAELEAYYESERSRFASPARFTGWHLYFSRELRQSTAIAAARAARRHLAKEALNPDEAVALGDAFPSGNRFTGQLPRQLASRFGEDFAEVAESLPEGQWSDPVETPFGVHLVLIQERTPARVPPFAAIRARVAAVYKSSERKKSLAAAMEELRARYAVVVEEDKDALRGKPGQRS